jgi:II/X family phage/plasmid replication protein
MMVDWLTVDLPDPVGLPVNDGHICRLRPDGTLDWNTACRKQIRGSWSSSMMFRALGINPESPSESTLQISGNPAKFLTGHNLFGSDCPTSLLTDLLERVGPDIWPDSYLDGQHASVAEGLISRIDLTATWELPRAEDVKPFLNAMEQRVWCPYRGRGVMDTGGSTLYYGRTDKGKRAKDWALKLYWKGPEITAHPLPQPAYEVAGLLDDANKWVRVELTLRTPELKRLGMRRVGDWSPAEVRRIWESYVAKLDFGETTINLDTVDLATLGLKTRHMTALATWKAGNDLRQAMSKTAFYRLRNELMDVTGFDIATARPTSNVIPLRRVVTASPVGRPIWADQLTRVLSVASA